MTITDKIEELNERMVKVETRLDNLESNVSDIFTRFNKRLDDFENMLTNHFHDALQFNRKLIWRLIVALLVSASALGGINLLKP